MKNNEFFFFFFEIENNEYYLLIWHNKYNIHYSTASYIRRYATSIHHKKIYLQIWQICALPQGTRESAYSIVWTIKPATMEISHSLSRQIQLVFITQVLFKDVGDEKEKMLKKTTVAWLVSFRKEELPNWGEYLASKKWPEGLMRGCISPLSDFNTFSTSLFPLSLIFA